MTLTCATECIKNILHACGEAIASQKVTIEVCYKAKRDFEVPTGIVLSGNLVLSDLRAGTESPHACHALLEILVPTH